MGFHYQKEWQGGIFGHEYFMKRLKTAWGANTLKILGISTGYFCGRLYPEIAIRRDYPDFTNFRLDRLGQMRVAQINYDQEQLDQSYSNSPGAMSTNVALRRSRL